ncbi:MAG: flagellar hook-associated protein FlgL [Hylemonella sp.]|nr:flagellar hook-associated protein FlgL [Hylemonella sp.]
MRVGTANSYDSTISNLNTRQGDLVDLQEKLSAGKRVVRASDDPTGAAQAERAMTRTDRIEVEQRALNLQRNAMAAAEATLGDANSVLQTLRDLVIAAGDGIYNPVNRSSIASQMRGLRDQLFALSNRLDTNGVPLFGGLASALEPFTDLVAGVSFNGLSGQRAASTVAIPSVLDGQAIWMNVPSGNGVFNIALGGANGGRLWTDTGQVLSPTALTGNDYTLSFSVNAATGATTYDIVNASTATTVAAGQAYVDGQDIAFDGLSFTAHGAPADGDTLQLTASTRTDLFAVVDAAIAGVDGAGNDAALSQAIALALTEIDAGMDRLQSARGFAGDLLNRADNIDNRQEAKVLQLAADRSRAEDMDMVQGISDFQNQQTGYDAALRTYAQVQRLSLFNYLG